MIKVIAFDLDDTLYPEKEYVFSGFKAVSELVKKRLGVEDFYPELVETFNESEKKKTFNVTLKRFGIKYDEFLIQNMVNCYRTHFPDIKVYDDVISTLDYLRREYHLALITDGYLQAQKNKVKALNIERLFERIIYADEYGKNCWKPSSLPYHLVMEYFSAKGDECVYIGDNMEKDFIAPNKMDWLTIQIKSKNRQCTTNIDDDSYRSKIRINTLKELKIILEGK